MKTKTTVRKCAIHFRVRCPLQWEQLAPTSDPGVRHCAVCRESVHLCTTDEQTLMHARAGHCIAREEPDASEFPSMIIGRPSTPVPDPTPSQRAAVAWEGRERGITAAIESRLTGDERVCPTCEYPVPDWRSSCYVCGRSLGRRFGGR